ncbi:MAG: DUF960 domain-containing protein [Clostridia bacterium]
MFDNKRFITRGIDENIPPLLQMLLWQLIDEMPVDSKDYLQVFSLSEEEGKQVVVHEQEEPEYRREHKFDVGEVIEGKVFVIDDETHSTMLMNYEY